MRISYVNKGINSFLEVNLGKSSLLYNGGYGYVFRMLEENRIDRLLDVNWYEINGEMIVRYNPGGYYVLSSMFMIRKPDGIILKSVLHQLMSCIEELKRYLLKPEDLVLDPSYIFYNQSEGTFKLMYIPGYARDIKKQLQTFFEYIFRVFDYHDQGGVEYLYDTYEKLGRGDVSALSPEQIYLSSLDCVQEELQVSELEASCYVNDATGYNGEGDVCKNDTEYFQLIPMNNGSLKPIILDGEHAQIIIGRWKKEVDYKIPGTQISKIHACIYRTNEGIFVQDRESTNGTFVNQERLSSMESRIISKGDIVAFANTEFFCSVS